MIDNMLHGKLTIEKTNTNKHRVLTHTLKKGNQFLH